MARLVDLPPRASEEAVVFEVKRQVTLIVGALTRTLTVPCPLQLPASDLRNGASSAWAMPPDSRASVVTAIGRDCATYRIMRLSFGPRTTQARASWRKL